MVLQRWTSEFNDVGHFNWDKKRKALYVIYNTLHNLGVFCVDKELTEDGYEKQMQVWLKIMCFQYFISQNIILNIFLYEKVIQYKSKINSKL